MTPILKVITEYCSQYVDDIRLSDLMFVDMPLYARRMYQYLNVGLPLFSIPANMQEYLLGTKDNSRFVEPKYDSTLYTTTKDYNTDFEINLGQDYKGYELCACRVKTIDKTGNTILTPIPVNYNAETGAVSISATTDNPIPSGTVFDFDFYTDGYFTADLTSSIMNILGMCFQVVWQDRFNTDWLSMVTKVEDKSFYEQNRANKIKADTERLYQLRQKLYSEMRRYDQNLYQSQTVNSSRMPKI